MTTIADELRREGERLGEKRGERRGERRGKRSGRREGKVDLLTEQLHERFGAVPESRCSQLASAAEADLDRWAVRLIKARDLDSVFE